MVEAGNGPGQENSMCKGHVKLEYIEKGQWETMKELQIQHRKCRHVQLIDYMAFYDKIFNRHNTHSMPYKTLSCHYFISALQQPSEGDGSNISIDREAEVKRGK